MLDIIAALVWIVSSLVLFLTAFFFIEILFSIKSGRLLILSDAVIADVQRKRAAILIPAHNEEDVIAATLDAIIPQLGDGDEVIVVADNCNDQTKNIAATYPVTVLERQHDKDRGKGYALDFALDYTRQQTFDVVLMVDADCVMGPQCRDRLVHACLEADRPVQCLYLMKTKGQSPSLSQKVAEFAWRIKNKLRPLGLNSLGGPCQLMGTGMAFPAGMLDDIELATACIVEDMKLGLDLAIEGKPPLFLKDAVVTSDFPDDEKIGAGQKTRWIHGHMEMIRDYGPLLLKTAIVKRNWQLLLLCFDLLVPPLVLLLFLALLMVLPAVSLALFTASSVYIIALAAVLIMGLGLLLSWMLAGRDLLTLGELMNGVIAKLKALSIYSSFFTNRLKSWNKTSRK